MGLSQAAFAKKIGISKGALQYYEKGEREPSASTIKKIAEISGHSIDWLMTEERTFGFVSPDDITCKIIQLLDGMEEEKRRDVLKHIKEKKLLEELLEERRQRKEAA